MQMWSDIPGYKPYQGCESGEIRNKHGRVMKDRRAINGARRINLGPHTRMVHNIIALTFLGPKPKGFVVKWRNRNRRDNRVSNLYYDLPGRDERSPVGLTCSRGHSLVSARTWGSGNNRICGDCAAGKRRIIELPEVL